MTTDPGDLEDQAESLKANGFKHIILTGDNQRDLGAAAELAWLRRLMTSTERRASRA